MKFVDYGVLILVIGVLLILGKFASDRIFNNMDYLLAGRRAKQLPLGLSLSATDIGGASILGAVALSYHSGVAGGWWLVCAIPAWIVLAFVLPPLYRKYSVTTVPELLERKYDLKTRVLVAILHMAGTIFAISAQTIVAALVVKTITGWSTEVSALIATLVFITYTALGGLIAVIWTDIFSIIILGSGMIAALITIIIQIGGPMNFVLGLPRSYYSLNEIGWVEPIGWILMSFLWYSTSQFYVQRIFAAKDKKTARNAFLISGGVASAFAVILVLLGMGMFVLNSQLPNGEAVVMEHILMRMPMGVKGLLLAAVLVGTMSTSSSYLNSCASIFTIDIFKRVIAPEADEIRCLNVARISSVVIGLISIVVMKLTSSVIDAIVFANMLFSAVVFLPIVLGLLNKKINANAAFFSIVVGALMAIAIEYFKAFENLQVYVHPILITFLLSVISLFILQGIFAGLGKQHKH